MKKSVVLTVVGSILMVLATAAFFLVPWICNSTLGEGFVCFYEFEEVVHDIPGLWGGLIGFKNMVMSIVVIAVIGVMLVLWLVHLILLIAKKRPGQLVLWFIFLLLTACFGALAILILTPGVPDYYRFAPEGSLFSWYSITIDWLVGGNAFGIAAFVIGTAVLALEVIGYILVVIGYIVAMAACCKKKEAEVVEEQPEGEPEAPEAPEGEPEAPEAPEEEPVKEEEAPAPEEPVKEEAPVEEPVKEEVPAPEPQPEPEPQPQPQPEPAPAPAPAPVPAKPAHEPEVIDIIPPEKRRYRVRMSAGSGVVRYFETKEEAIAYAKGLARSRGVNVIVKH